MAAANSPRAASLPDGFVTLVASRRLHADPRSVIEALTTDRGPWAEGLLDHSPAEGLRRYLIDLRLRLGGDAIALTTFRKAAYLDLGPPRQTAEGWELELGWRAATGAPLFPVFAGRLLIEPKALRIEGIYAPPGGVIGRVADRVLFHVAANATANWLLAEIDRAARQGAA